MRIEGLYHVLCTPFDERGELDLSSLRRLTETVIGLGVDGLTVLGVMGEAQKLTAAERTCVLQEVQEVNAGRVPVVVGASQNGTVPAIAAVHEAASLGASAVMLAPPTFLGAGEALTEHLGRVAAEGGLPIVFQDYPVASGVNLTIPAMAQLIEDVPEIVSVKLESPPTGRRAGALLDRTGERVTVLGGLGGLYLVDELRHGTHGTMTGLAVPEALVRICADWLGGELGRSVATHARVMPLLVADSQPVIGLSVRKQVWVERGIIASAEIRSPGTRLNAKELAGLREMLAEIDREVPVTIGLN